MLCMTQLTNGFIQWCCQLTNGFIQWCCQYEGLAGVLWEGSVSCDLLCILVAEVVGWQCSAVLPCSIERMVSRTISCWC
jgi:hypothetical protein